MSDLDNIIASIKELPIEDLSFLHSELANITKEKAMKELARREEEINQLRLMAGMKKKPLKRDPATISAPVTGARRGRKPRAVVTE